MIKILRVAITFFSCYVMWFTPTASVDFFRSLLILSMGYGYDYYSLKEIGVKSHDAYHKKVGWVGAIVSLIFFLIGLAGLSGGFIISLTDEPFMIKSSSKVMFEVSLPLKWLLMSLTIFPILAGFELWGCATDKDEDNGGGGQNV